MTAAEEEADKHEKKHEKKEVEKKTAETGTMAEVKQEKGERIVLQTLYVILMVELGGWAGQSLFMK
jgi:hypothetical protein